MRSIRSATLRAAVAAVVIATLAAACGAALPDSSPLTGVARLTSSSPSASLSSVVHMRALDFVDATHGWAAGAAGVNWRRPLLMATVDGRSWHRVQLPTRLPIEALDFIDQAHGWIAVQMSPGGGHRGMGILRTSDGGKTWQQVVARSLVTLLGERPLFFQDALHGWIVGTRHDPRLSIVLRTDDGGVSWHEVPVTGKMITFTSVAFLDEARGWISGYDNQAPRHPASHIKPPAARAFFTTDGGATWHRWPHAPRPIEHLFRLDSTHMWGLGRRYQLLQWRPEPGGAGSWRTASQGRSRDSGQGSRRTVTRGGSAGSGMRRAASDIPTRFAFATPQEGWGIVYRYGEEGVVVGWKLVRTIDGGATWRRYPMKIPSQPVDVACPAPGLVYVLSENSAVIRIRI